MSEHQDITPKSAPAGRRHLNHLDVSICFETKEILISDVVFCVVIDLPLVNYYISVWGNACHSMSNVNCFKLIQYGNWVFYLKISESLNLFYLTHHRLDVFVSKGKLSWRVRHKLTTMLTECEERFPLVFMVQLRPKHQNFANLQNHLGLCHQKIRSLWCILNR